VVEEPFADTVAAALDSVDGGLDPDRLSLSVDGTGDVGTVRRRPASRRRRRIPRPDGRDGCPHLFLHTGGSTGAPKETVLPHEAIVWNSVNTITGWGLREDDLTPMAFPLFHTGGWNVLTVPSSTLAGRS